MDGSREAFARLPETVYSPVAEMATVRVLFALAAALGHQVLQADFKNAYLNAEMDEEKYVAQPYGLEEHDNEDKVCLLKRALYGCSVSGKRWNKAISGAIESLGYQRSTIDHCKYARRREDYSDLLVLYVDDILAFSTQGREKTESQLGQLGEIYDIKRLGKARHMLGIGIHQQGDKITLEQGAYLESILAEANYIEAKPRSTPWGAHLKEDSEPVDITELAVFRRILGQLMYLSTATRPDITFAVGRLSSSMSAPTKGAWNRLKRVLKYLNGTRELGISYQKGEENLRLDIYVDSSYGTDPKKGRSLTGYVTYIAGGPIVWKSHLQSTVADSVHAAEYIALHEAAVSAMGSINMLSELGISMDPPTLWEDNDGSRRLATSGLGQRKARHLDIKYHYVQQLCKEGKIAIKRVAGDQQTADILTKGSHTAKFYTYLRDLLGVRRTE